MKGISTSVTKYLLTLLTSPHADLTTPEEGSDESGMVAFRTISIQNAAPDVIEKTGTAKYPSILIYCEKLSNNLRDKFCIFSGFGKFCIELRSSHDRIEPLESMTLMYTDYICNVLDQSRGGWGSGTYYPGGYDVIYGPVKIGGSRFIQTAKILVEINISR
jgi:hypothetical protein